MYSSKPFRIYSVTLFWRNRNTSYLLTCDVHVFFWIFAPTVSLGVSFWWIRNHSSAGRLQDGSDGEVRWRLAPGGEAAAHFKHLCIAKCNRVWREQCLHSFHPHHMKDIALEGISLTAFSACVCTHSRFLLMFNLVCRVETFKNKPAVSFLYSWGWNVD